MKKFQPMERRPQHTLPPNSPPTAGHYALAPAPDIVYRQFPAVGRSARAWQVDADFLFVPRATDVLSFSRLTEVNLHLRWYNHDEFTYSLDSEPVQA